MNDPVDYFRANRFEELDFDTVEAIDLDGTGRDGDPRFPYTWEKLTGSERVKLGAWVRLSASERARICEQRHQQSMVAAGVSRAAL